MPPAQPRPEGIPYGAPADIATTKAMADNLPQNAVFSGFAISRDQMPFVALLPMLGGNVRVGLEDNLYLKRGVLASNSELVEKAGRILTDIGCRILGPEDVRTKLNLVKHEYCGEIDYMVGERVLRPVVPVCDFPPEDDVSVVKTALCLGGGVIGSGWAARFALRQIDTFQHHPRIQNLILFSDKGLKCVRSTKIKIILVSGVLRVGRLSEQY